MDQTHRLDFYVKAPQARVLGQRGIFLEITYAPAVCGEPTLHLRHPFLTLPPSSPERTACRNVIANAQNLVRITRGRQLVAVSQAEQALHLRAPHDVANLLHMFGFSHEVGYDCRR